MKMVVRTAMMAVVATAILAWSPAFAAEAARAAAGALKDGTPIEAITPTNAHGIALEPRKFPDAPSHPGFVSARVDPGRPYRHAMIFRISTMEQHRA